jgi:methionyl-tRNA formyltransferase
LSKIEKYSKLVFLPMSTVPYKIGFLGSDEIAIPFLSNLMEESNRFQLVGVLTQPDRPAGRGRNLRPNPIKEWTMQHGLPCRDPRKPSSDEVDWFEDLGVDILLVMAYGHILKNDMLTVASAGCFNLHASILPAYRGASPIETALACGDDETGVTLMRVVPKMDAGPVIDVEKVKIDDSTTGPSLRASLAKCCAPLMQRNLQALCLGEYEEVEQDESLVSYCRKLKKADGFLDFSQPASLLASRIRAFQAWPGSFFEHRGNRIKIGLAQANSGSGLRPGEIKKTAEGALLIGTETDALQINNLQKPGGKMISSSDFLRGYTFEDGEILGFPSTESLLV